MKSVFCILAATLSLSAFAGTLPLAEKINSNGVSTQASVTISDDGQVTVTSTNGTYSAQLSGAALAGLKQELIDLNGEALLIDQTPSNIFCDNTAETTYSALLDKEESKIGLEQRCHSYRRADGSAEDIIALLDGYKL
jgi:hypothetical protein